MKKLIIVLIVLLSFSVSASSETILFFGDGGKYVETLWSYDGSLYIFTEHTYLQMTDGETVEYSFEPEFPNGEFLIKLIPTDEALWALLKNDDGITSLAKFFFTEDGTPYLSEPLPIACGELIDTEDLVYDSPMIVDDTFAFTATQNDGFGVVVLYNILAGTGELIESDADGYAIDVLSVTPYNRSTALVASAIHAQNGGIAFYTLDMNTGDISFAFEVPAVDHKTFGGPICDIVNKQVYYLLDGSLWRVTGFNSDDMEVIADAASIDSIMDVYLAIPGDGTVVVADWSSVHAYATDGETMTAETLSIAASNNELINKSYYAYLKEYPDAQIDISNKSLSPGDVSQAILTQSTEYDIYVTSLNWTDYDALYTKEYLAPLTDSKKLTAFAAELYPAIQDTVEKDGVLVALPIELEVSTATYNPVAFHALGLTETDVPTTWPEFLRLLQRLPEIIEGTDYTPFDPSCTAEEWAEDIYMSFLYDYMLYLEHEPSASMKFDSEIMRTLLAEFEKIDFEALSTGLDWDEDADIQIAEQHTLFQLSRNVGSEARASSQMTAEEYGVDAPVYTYPMPLSLGNEKEPTVKGEIVVAIVNPYSGNKATALAFLEATLGQMPETACANMMPSWTEPIKMDGIDEMLADYKRQIAELEEEVANAKGDAKSQYQELLDTWTESYADWQEKYWFVTEKDLALYRTYACYIRIWHNFGLDMEGDGVIYHELSRYMGGAIDAETMLQNIDKKINMMLLEE